MVSKFYDVSDLANRTTVTTKLENIGNAILERNQVLTLKRYALLKPALAKAVREESEKLFKFIAEKAVNVQANPFKFYSKKQWPALSKSTIRKKKHSNFWYDSGTLKNWLLSTSPASVYGNPFIDIKGASNFARGRQRVVIEVNPFPKTNLALPDQIYYRLFARKKVKSGTGQQIMTQFISNEEQRPIESPAKRQLINYRINRKVDKVIREVLNGNISTK